MREAEIVHRHGLIWALSVVLLGTIGGCKPDTSAGDPAPTRASEPATKLEPKLEPNAKPKPVANDPERSDKLADLDAMCSALNHDYDDGTLTDYYRDIQPRTEWGKAQRDAGNESIQPGRLLAKATAELDPDNTEPSLSNCRTLLDYLDDVE